MPPYITTSYYDYIQPTDTVVIAVSGGVDSMVLLYYILSVHSRQHIVVAHFDHSLRGIESDMDRQLVESFCNKENIRYEMKKMDI
jgi:tRNA(Ile)-lysidine synthase